MTPFVILTNTGTMILFQQREFGISGRLLGYRSMWKRLSTLYGLSVRRLVNIIHENSRY